MATAASGSLLGKGHLPRPQVKFFVYFHPDGNAPLHETVCWQHRSLRSEGAWTGHWERPIRPKFATCHRGHGEGRGSGLPHAFNTGDGPRLEHLLPCPAPWPGCRGLRGRPHLPRTILVWRHQSSAHATHATFLPPACRAPYQETVRPETRALSLVIPNSWSLVSVPRKGTRALEKSLIPGLGRPTRDGSLDTLWS